ncbi:hypothetical protein GCM10010377_30540 [Streptomyces viridiviolaceus]|uniref:Transposase n=1 Tax=Streptomyces viridiviolaceus TaxID=68282 RepID=A0ABW2E8T9_9ACTN|nr:hypothetical protein [Streptomyces viridiviolaceus]GHB37423.1 hypothetical protein GCM10010377_30540 [Streptomyces viridiviolaceus]
MSERAWAKKLSGEDRCGLTALSWSNVNPCGTFRLDVEYGDATQSVADLTDPGGTRPCGGRST